GDPAKDPPDHTVAVCVDTVFRVLQVLLAGGLNYLRLRGKRNQFSCRRAVLLAERQLKAAASQLAVFQLDGDLVLRIGDDAERQSGNFKLASTDIPAAVGVAQRAVGLTEAASVCRRRAVFVAMRGKAGGAQQQQDNKREKRWWQHLCRPFRGQWTLARPM